MRISPCGRSLQRSAVAIYRDGEYREQDIDVKICEPADNPRESYIDGIWNKEDPEEWTTEVRVPDSRTRTSASTSSSF